MSSKMKMYVIHIGIFVAVFFMTRFITTQFVVDPTIWTTMIPLGCAWLLAPKPYVEDTQSGKQYGLRVVFSNKIIKL